ncbi:MAG TPA: hypothetical protein VKE40_05305 [Gemmataceae bacterium]|nr:hypothetical protein [Gemmataceae bacterium]
MLRSFVVAAVGVFLANSAFAQCHAWPPLPVPGYYPYPLTPAIWGAPAPKPLPPLPPPFVPKPGVGVKEVDETPPPPKPGEKSKNGTKPKEGDAKDKDAPRIPKLKFPGPGEQFDPDEPAPRKEPPKTDSKKDAGANGKDVEQFLVPADEKRSEPPAEVKVGFFNHSDRDLVLEVNGEPLKLPSEQYVTKRLPRTFKWAEKGKPATDVTIPPDADGIEIVFRK